MGIRFGRIRLWHVLLITLGLSAVAAARAASSNTPALYAGGVAGITDLLDPANSQTFRAMGGGLYLHNSGWQELTADEKKRVLGIFRGAPIAIELGFGSGAAWGRLYEKDYLAYGIVPTFVAANAFNPRKHPAPEQWRDFSAVLHEDGVPSSALILPIFGGAYIATLGDNMVSRSPDFRAIVQAARGVVLDTPPAYAMEREQMYRDWVVDAIRWTTQRGLTSVVILSPHNAGVNWGEATIRYVRYLNAQGATPSIFVCENYRASAPFNYPNRVGNDRLPYSALGNCELLEQQVLRSR